MSRNKPRDTIAASDLPHFLENIVSKAVKMANHSPSPPEGKPLIRRHKINLFEAILIAAPPPGKTSEIKIECQATEVFHALLEPGWESNPSRINLIKKADKPKGWLNIFLNLPFHPKDGEGS